MKFIVFLVLLAIIGAAFTAPLPDALDDLFNGIYNLVNDATAKGDLGRPVGDTVGGPIDQVLGTGPQ